MIKKLPLIPAVLALILAPALSFGGPAFSHDYTKALAKAKASNKPLILIFSASWCPPCQQMKHSVYPSKEVQPYHDKFVWAYLDADLKENARVLGAYGVSGIPHIEFLTPGGKSMGHFAGAVSPEKFTEVLDKVLKISAGKMSGQKQQNKGGSGSRSRR